MSVLTTTVLMALAPLLADPGPTAGVDHDLGLTTSQLQALGAKLPEAPGAASGLAGRAWSPELRLAQDARVFVSWVGTPGGSRPSLGSFVYDDAGELQIEAPQLLLPDASAHSLAPGQGASVRNGSGQSVVWPAGTQLGLFVLPDGWNDEPAVQDWAAAAAPWPSVDPSVNATASAGQGLVSTVDALHGEHAQGASSLARHAVLTQLDDVPGLEHALLLGFEVDNRMTDADDDFNDAVFVVTTDPPGALDLAQVPSAMLGDPDGDGVSGTADFYPWDPARAYVERVPQHGWNTLGFEDLYPETGDRDYNDLVAAYAFEVVTSADGDVHDLLATLHLVARGASHDHKLGLHIPGLPMVAGTVQIEHFLSDADETHTVLPPSLLADAVAAGSRFENLFPSVAFALTPQPGLVFTNTQTGTVETAAASARLLISLVEPLDASLIGKPPYDPYVLVNDGLGFDVDVHLVGKPAFDERREGLPDETGPDAFTDPAGLPWLLEVPIAWRFPIESTDMADAYPEFLAWAASHGTLAEDWVDTVDVDVVAPRLTKFLVQRDWIVDLPGP